MKNTDKMEMVTLAEFKAEWQTDSTVLVEYNDRHLGARVVICESWNSTPENPKYTVFRYFRLGGRFECSMDKKSRPISEILKWMAEQLGEIVESP